MTSDWRRRSTPRSHGLEKRVALLFALAALLLAGCGGSAERRPPAGPNDSRITAQASGGSASRDSDAAESAPSAPSPAPAAEPAQQAAGAPGRNEFGAPPAPPPPPPKAEKKGEPQKDAPRADGTEAPHETSMLIYTARVTMAVYQVEQGLLAVEKIAKENGGYLSVKHDREIVIRVPRNRFEPALAQVDKIGDVLHRDIQALDVTDEFVDTEIRIKNARAMQVRLKVLLEKASVKEALEIEKEMRRVTEELELLEGKLKLLKDKIAFSTITVVFEARGSTISTTRIKLPFPWLTQVGLPRLLQLSEDR
jgi:hypothetical protein